MYTNLANIQNSRFAKVWFDLYAYICSRFGMLGTLVYRPPIQHLHSVIGRRAGEFKIILNLFVCTNANYRTLLTNLVLLSARRQATSTAHQHCQLLVGGANADKS